jgi:DNA-damage-inducible protein J
MDSDLKNQVEELYRNLGTSFAEAVRIFAQQSLLDGGMPFKPSLKTWDEMTDKEIGKKLYKSEEDITAGRVYAQEDIDTIIRERLNGG